MATISDTARTRRKKLVEGDMFAGSVSRIVDSKSRDVRSANDLQHIKDRQEAESLPEGGVRRPRKKSSY